MQGFKMLLAAAAASTLAATALPASAQSYGSHWGYGPPPPPSYQPVFDRGPVDRGDALRAREDRLGGWIANSARDGRIGGWQVRRLFDDLRSIHDEERSIRDRQYGRLYPDQAFRLSQRLDRLSERVRDAQAYGAPRWDYR